MRKILLINLGVLVVLTALLGFMLLFPRYTELERAKQAARKQEMAVFLAQREMQQLKRQVATDKAYSTDFPLLREFLSDMGFKVQDDTAQEFFHFTGDFSRIEEFLSEVKGGLAIKSLEITPTVDYPVVEVKMEIGGD